MYSYRITTQFKFGDEVFLKTATEEIKGMVTAITLEGNENNVIYTVTWSDDRDSSDHHGFELTTNFVKTFAD